MDELISRQDAIEAIDRERKKKHLFNTAEDGLLEARGVINTLPSAQPLTAYIISDEDGNIKCSNCGSYECWGNFCMDCGARMRGEQDE